MDNLDKKVGRNVRVWRARNNISQTELAKRLGFSQGYVSNLERGVKKLDLQTIERISRTIGVDVADLIRENGI